MHTDAAVRCALSHIAWDRDSVHMGPFHKKAGIAGSSLQRLF